MAYAGIGRFLLKYAPDLLAGAYAAYLSTEQKEVAPEFQGRRCQVVQTRGTTEDVIVNTFDFVNITSGALDTTWTAGDFGGVEARLRTFYAAVFPYVLTGGTLKEFRWSILPNPAGVENPAVRVGLPSPALGTSGSGTSYLPPQVALSITKVVPPRRHWGRIYLGPIQIALSSPGRYGTTIIDAAAAAHQALIAGCQADDTPMVVWAHATGIALAVEGTRVDDVPDIIRSRRFDRPVYRKVLP